MGRIIGGSVDQAQISTTQSTPASGYQKLYVKTDNRYYTLDSSGTETLMGPHIAGAGLALTGQTFSIGVGGVTSNMIQDGAIQLADMSATGTRDSTTFLRGDNTWQVPPSGGGVSDGDKGDITVSGGVWTIDNSTVTSAKIADGTIALADLSAALIQILCPAGIISPYAGHSGNIPSGWLLCDGHQLSTTEATNYPTLVLALLNGTTPIYGGTQAQPNLPNFLGRMALGAGAASGANIAGTTRTLGNLGGADTINSSMLPPHTHTTPAHNHPIDLGNTGGTTTTVLAKATGTIANSQATGPFNPNNAGGGNTGDGGFANNSITSPFQVINYIIKAH